MERDQISDINPLKIKYQISDPPKKSNIRYHEFAKYQISGLKIRYQTLKKKSIIDIKVPPCFLLSKSLIESRISTNYFIEYRILEPPIQPKCPLITGCPLVGVSPEDRFTVFEDGKSDNIIVKPESWIEFLTIISMGKSPCVA